MQKRKVLHILNSTSYSGAENVVINIIKNMGDFADSIYLSPNGTIGNVLAENGIKYYPVSKLSVGNIKKAIKDLNPDIIHAHDFTAGIITCVVAGKIPVINHLHNNSPWLKKICVNSLVYGFSCFKYNKILTVSNSVMDEYIFGNLFKKKCGVVDNPIDIESIRNKCVECNDENIVESDILFLGRLTLPKNPLFFLEVIADVIKDIPGLKVSMVGDGDMRADIEEKIKENKLEDNITIHGFQSNPYLYMERTKVLCMPSLWEGFGLVAVEALIFGKPVLASPVGGLPGIVDETCGSLCETREQFVDSLKKYLTDNEYYKMKSDAAFKKAEILNNIEDYTQNIKNIYTDILS